MQTHNTFSGIQYVEKLFVRKQCPRQYIISITQQMWHCVHLNDKKAVYRLIVCSDADANCTNGHPSFSTSLTLAEVMLLHECSKSTLHRSMSCMSADSAYKLSTRSTFSSSSSTSDEQKEVDECLDGCSLLHVACHTADASMIDSFTVWG